MDKNLIKDIVLAVTYKCNSRCSFCNIWQKKEDFSCQPSDYKKLPHNLENVNISGGEPFLRDDLLEIVKVISRQCPKAKIVISTNGFLPSKIKQTMQRIAKFKKDIGVAVSLDGFGKVHEELRGFSGGYCLAIETIKLLKELNIKDVKIAFTLGDKNASQLKRIYRLSKEMGVEFSLSLYHNSSHYFQKENNLINNTRIIKRELNWLIKQELNTFSPKRWGRAYFAWAMIKFLETNKRVLPDYSGLSSLFIDPSSKIYPSNVWNLEIGKLYKITNWDEFSKKTKELILNDRGPSNWMICTARQTMKKHRLKIIKWILREKYLNKINKKYPEKQISLFFK